MAEYLTMDVLVVTAYVITLFVCLGLISYVVWCWRKRMRYSSRGAKRFPE